MTKRVWARFFSNNPASGRMMEKVGMTKEGVQVKHIIKEGEFQDLILYGIVKE
ncbi:MAG: GNAT family N-acetyltransferase [Defluviitaleaceae bacterium]|nr:GNAT family N-acetyltransferase [Defluviitaleaceae bacterium]